MKHDKDVPPIEVYEAAEILNNYFLKQRNEREWEFSHVASRLLVFKLQREVRALKFQIKQLTN
jgi:hypothetical protein